MSSDSDSEDDVQIKQFLEATDTSLLNSSMFQKTAETTFEKEASQAEIKAVKSDFKKSQRYIIEDNENAGVDFHLPETMQNHLAKKFSEISEKYYEFYDASKESVPKLKTKCKNRVKLLKDSDCFVNSYEDFKDDIKGPTKKPVIRRRLVFNETDDCYALESDYDTLKAVAVDANYILSGQEVATWAKKKERKDKVFYYKMASNGVSHAKEDINEFTAIRNKNKWKETKIKSFKKT